MGSDWAATATAIEGRACSQARIDAFKESIRIVAGHKIHEGAIWKFARYKSDTQWKRWKSGRLSADSSAAKAFTQILAMSPAEFVEKLKKQNSRANVSHLF